MLGCLLDKYKSSVRRTSLRRASKCITEVFRGQSDQIHNAGFTRLNIKHPGASEWHLTLNSNPVMSPHATVSFQCLSFSSSICPSHLLLSFSSNLFSLNTLSLHPFPFFVTFWLCGLVAGRCLQGQQTADLVSCIWPYIPLNLSQVYTLYVHFVLFPPNSKWHYLESYFWRSTKHKFNKLLVTVRRHLYRLFFNLKWY